MKEHPILFSGPMVRAILDGRKTQTRRVVKSPARLEGLMLKGEEAEWCPYGGPGDRLWVRETHAPLGLYGHEGPLVQGEPLQYQADDELLCLNHRYAGRWRPSIYMPRWASRITLEVTEVRVEQVRDISTDDALAEGVDLSRELFPSINAPDKALRLFPRLWDSINGKKYPWEANPWVWVLGFAAID